MRKLVCSVSILGAIGMNVFICIPAMTAPLNVKHNFEGIASQDFPGLISRNDTKKSEPMLKVGSLRELKGDNTCRGTGGIMTYAETKNFRVYICADKNDRTQPRYYRSFDRHGKGGLNLEAIHYNPRQMRYFEFKNKGYTYTLQIPTAQIPNPVLAIQFPNGKFIQERVLRYVARSEPY